MMKLLVWKKIVQFYPGHPELDSAFLIGESDGHREESRGLKDVYKFAKRGKS